MPRKAQSKPKLPTPRCANPKCRFGQPLLLLKQKKYCSHQCVAETTRCRKATPELIRLFDMKVDTPRATMAELAQALGLSASQVKSKLYQLKCSPWFCPPSQTELQRREQDKELRRNQKGFVLTARSAEASLRPKLFAKPRKALIIPAERINWCQHEAGDVWLQCMSRAMPGSSYCIRHHRRLKHAAE